MDTAGPKYALAGDRTPGSGTGFADIGNEPPIEVDGRLHTVHDHRQVSLRWLLGTVLTGLTGAALIGSAIYAAFDHQSTFAQAPQASVPVHRDGESSAAVSPGKGDRLVQPVDLVAAKQAFRIPTAIKVGDKEILKSRSFTRISTNLTLASLGFSNDVPDFNPLTLVSDARNPVDPAPDPGPAADDAEVSFVTRDLNLDDFAALATNLSAEESQAQIVEHIRNAISAGNKPALPIPSQMLLMRTSRAGLDPTGGLGAETPLAGSPFSSIQVKMVVENVTVIPKAEANFRNPVPTDKLVVVHKGEGLEDVLRNSGVSKDQMRAIAAAFGTKRNELVTEGKRLKIQMADFDGSGRDMRVARVSVYADEALEAQVGLADDGAFQRAAQQLPVVKPAAARTAKDNTTDDSEDDGTGMRLYDSLFETALKQALPRPMIDDLVRIFANDVDFQRSVTGGDSIEAFYREPEEGETRGELLYAAITSRSETFHYYRYQARDDGSLDYYDESGRSTRKFLIRTPIVAARLSSPFGYRYHPILGYRKFHSGQDWAAPVGTPIVASGNGTIIKAAWDAGYGRRVEIQHPNGYITTYNHMSGWARGITDGSRVRQGQLIGYVGQTGLATGPHLHYEVMINGNFVDPMRVKLARTKEFDGAELASFKRERDRIDGLLAKAPNATGKLAEQR